MAEKNAGSILRSWFILVSFFAGDDLGRRIQGDGYSAFVCVVGDTFNAKLSDIVTEKMFFVFDYIFVPIWDARYYQ